MAVRVFLELGDSNAVGFNMSAATLPATLRGYDYGATFAFDAEGGHWGVYAPGVNSGTPTNPGAWGPEAQFLRRVHEAASPGDVTLIISVQKGSTPLARDGAVLDWSPSSAGEMFATAKATVAAARAAFEAANGYPMPPIDAVLWIGGPNDATDAGRAAGHHQNLQHLFDAIRGELLGQPDVEILFPRMTDDPAALSFNQDVRVAQWSVDQLDPLATSFKTIGYGMQPDHVHYDAGGYVQLGDGLFDAWTF